MEAKYKAGKKDELSTEWYKNARKKSEERFTMGKLVSSVVSKPNGDKWPVTNVKDGNGFLALYDHHSCYSLSRLTYKDGKHLKD